MTRPSMPQGIGAKMLSDPGWEETGSFICDLYERSLRIPLPTGNSNINEKCIANEQEHPNLSNLYIEIKLSLIDWTKTVSANSKQKAVSKTLEQNLAQKTRHVPPHALERHYNVFQLARASACCTWCHLLRLSGPRWAKWIGLVWPKIRAKPNQTRESSTKYPTEANQTWPVLAGRDPTDSSELNQKNQIDLVRLHRSNPMNSNRIRPMGLGWLGPSMRVRHPAIQTGPSNENLSPIIAKSASATSSVRLQ